MIGITALTAPALTGALDPAAFDQPFVFEAIERRIQRRDVKTDGSLRSLADQPREIVAVALSLLSRASAADLAGILETPGVFRLVKACAERHLARRRKRD